MDIFIGYSHILVLVFRIPTNLSCAIHLSFTLKLLSLANGIGCLFLTISEGKYTPLKAFLQFKPNSLTLKFTIALTTLKILCWDEQPASLQTSLHHDRCTRPMGGRLNIQSSTQRCAWREEREPIFIRSFNLNVGIQCIAHQRQFGGVSRSRMDQ